MANEPLWQVVARIGRPHGLRGECTVRSRTDDPSGRFVPGARFRTDPDVGDVVLVAARESQGRWSMLLEGCDSREDAESLRGIELLVDVSADEQSEDEWLVNDLVGLSVHDTTGRHLGEVVDLEPGAAQDLLVVRAPLAGIVRVPFVRALVPTVDVVARVVVVDPPGGLFPEGA